MKTLTAAAHRVALLASFTTLLLLGCGDEGIGNEGDVVGGTCETADDCHDRCVRSGDFPQGVCTVSCSVDDDCPDGTHCIAKEGGICLLACELPSDCRGGFTCQGEENRGHGGDSLVCVGD